MVRHWFEDNGEGPGTYSSSSVTSSPNRRSLPPQWPHSALAGVSSTSMRGIWSGIGLRFALLAGASSGRRSLAVIAAMAISVVSKASCNCSEVSDGEEDQKKLKGNRNQSGGLVSPERGSISRRTRSDGRDGLPTDAAASPLSLIAAQSTAGQWISTAWDFTSASKTALNARSSAKVFRQRFGDIQHGYSGLQSI